MFRFLLGLALEVLEILLTFSLWPSFHFEWFVCLSRDRPTHINNSKIWCMLLAIQNPEKVDDGGDVQI
ncbi:hypothetical protein HUJ04_008300 [Dendroctonus ponderosae]|nr:hypothetical protein HUJ04_008300 [Dendroctonus ponderosae]